MGSWRCSASSVVSAELWHLPVARARSDGRLGGAFEHEPKGALHSKRREIGHKRENKEREDMELTCGSHMLV
jgi:hypothetical protein